MVPFHDSVKLLGVCTNTLGCVIHAVSEADHEAEQFLTAQCVCIARTLPSQDVHPSIRPSVCPSITRRYCVVTATFHQTVFHCRVATCTILVFFRSLPNYIEWQLMAIFRRGPPNGGVECRWRLTIKSRFSTNIWLSQK